MPQHSIQRHPMIPQDAGYAPRCGSYIERRESSPSCPYSHLIRRPEHKSVVRSKRQSANSETPRLQLKWEVVSLHQIQMLFTVNWEHFRSARWARAFTKGNHLKTTKCKQDELTASSNTHHSRSTALSHVKMQATHVPLMRVTLNNILKATNSSAWSSKYCIRHWSVLVQKIYKRKVKSESLAGQRYRTGGPCHPCHLAFRVGSSASSVRSFTGQKRRNDLYTVTLFLSSLVWNVNSWAWRRMVTLLGGWKAKSWA
jgi:hypothetical protein